ncbi:transcriptional regulator [Pseudonocardia humida]|uniref:Transcriptional regulator n=1 Tax=Pseudonocardia humida TaxID=2800819 RepID=A0ABT1A396_9PSEU|nr:transcriptional regulator [Pseudonocardia humida]MCO1657478.1 transcriptional regulator [Pseudonocardia humida]
MVDPTEPPAAQRLDPLLLDPTRLRIAAALAGAGEVEFKFVRDRAGLTDSALSKQVRTLSDADLVSLRRERTGPARRAWIRLTPHGRAVLAEHARALREIADSAEHDRT